jgi:hypothetical protein
MDIQDIQWEARDGTDLVQDRDNWLALMNMMMNLQVP